MAEKKEKSPDFEKAIKELEKLVEKMEKGDLPLEEALEHFERGIELTRSCQSSLKEAEQKVQILLEKAGQAKISTFDEDD